MILQICAVLLFLTAMVTITRQLHFLQLNSYFNSRFFDYLKGEFKLKTVFSIICGALVAIFAIFDLSVLTLIVTVIFSAIRVYYTIYKIKHAKKVLFSLRE